MAITIKEIEIESIDQNDVHTILNVKVTLEGIQPSDRIWLANVASELEVQDYFVRPLRVNSLDFKNAGLKKSACVAKLKQVREDIEGQLAPKAPSAIQDQYVGKKLNLTTNDLDVAQL